MLPNPLWHLSFDQIADLQFVNMTPKLLAGGLTIIPSVQVHKLIGLMPESDRLLYSKKLLYNDSQDARRITRIIEYWQKGEKLTPPTMIVFNAECIEVMGLGSESISTEIRPHDGKHRLNAACSTGVKAIPIIVRTPQLILIKQMLGF